VLERADSFRNLAGITATYQFAKRYRIGAQYTNTVTKFFDKQFQDSNIHNISAQGSYTWYQSGRLTSDVSYTNHFVKSLDTPMYRSMRHDRTHRQRFRRLLEPAGSLMSLPCSPWTIAGTFANFAPNTPSIPPQFRLCKMSTRSPRIIFAIFQGRKKSAPAPLPIW